MKSSIDIDLLLIIAMIIAMLRGCDRDDFNERARASGNVTRFDQDGDPLCYDDTGVETCWD